MAYTWATTTKGTDEPPAPVPWARIAFTAALLVLLHLPR